MARLRFNGPNPVQLPTPFGYIVNPGDVVEVSDSLVNILRQTNYSTFGAMPGSGTALPPFEQWTDANEGAPESEPETHTTKKAKADDSGD